MWKPPGCRAGTRGASRRRTHVELGARPRPSAGTRRVSNPETHFLTPLMPISALLNLRSNTKSCGFVVWEKVGVSILKQQDCQSRLLGTWIQL